MNKRGILLMLIALLAGCAQTAAPAQVDVGTQAIFASQTRDAAGSAANVLSVLAAQTALAATSTRQAQVNQLNDAGTRTALQVLQLQPTQTREAMQTAEAHQEATENAQQAATVRSNFATYAAQTPTARAIATGTALAIANVTATWEAEQPTREYIAATVRSDAAQRQQQQDVAEMRAMTERTLTPLLTGLGLVFPFVLAAVVVAFLCWGLALVFGAVVRRLNAETLRVQADSFQKLVLVDRGGNIIGYALPPNSALTVKLLDEPPAVEGESEPVPPRTITDMQDHQTPPQLPAPKKDPDMLNDMIHRLDLRVFVETILSTGDWTQKTWADKTLPRGFVLSKDTEDADGKRVWGGYARLLQLFVEKHLIIRRKAGAAGVWNPLAPQQVDAVMAILFNEAPLPELPQEPELPTPKPRTRARRTLVGQPN